VHDVRRTRLVEKQDILQHSTRDNVECNQVLQPFPFLHEGVSDEVLMQAIARGSARALESLYLRYHHFLYMLTYRKVQDHQVAEDLLQETFLAVWCRATSYSPHAGSVRAWLCSIMQHRTIDYLRQAQRRFMLDAEMLDEIDDESGATSADIWDEAWRSVLRTHVNNAMSQLPEEQQLVIRLTYFQGWTHAQIAACFHIPLGTVKARARLALFRLKRILMQMGIDGQ
jgi:RNA polymerase sigma factor (sigma-70 family)